MKVKKEFLLLVAGTVWALAGINILRIGITAYIPLFLNETAPFLLLMLLLSTITLTGFSAMFHRVVKRNTTRILSYPAKKNVFAFLDLKGYLLMAFMMGLGIVLRVSDLLPGIFFAIFYSGLGSALGFSGIRFILQYFQTRSSHK